jgi:hypothetical protein
MRKLPGWLAQQETKAGKQIAKRLPKRIFFLLFRRRIGEFALDSLFRRVPVMGTDLDSQVSMTLRGPLREPQARKPFVQS